MSENSKQDLGQVLGLILGREKMSIELHPRNPMKDVMVSRLVGMYVFKKKGIGLLLNMTVNPQ